MIGTFLLVILDNDSMEEQRHQNPHMCIIPPNYHVRHTFVVYLQCAGLHPCPLPPMQLGRPVATT